MMDPRAQLGPINTPAAERLEFADGRGASTEAGSAPSSVISRRHCFHQISGGVTFPPFLSMSGSGSVGYRFALACARPQ